MPFHYGKFFPLYFFLLYFFVWGIGDEVGKWMIRLSTSISLADCAKEMEWA